MAETVFTFPGKAGDAVLQWPIAYWWAKENGKQFDCWMDEKSTALVRPLFEAQSCVDTVEFKPGVESYNCGGQPWHFGMETKDFNGKTVHHLGFRSFPQRQITLETKATVKFHLDVDVETIAETCSLETASGATTRRLVLHGQPVYAHTKATPSFWKFLAQIEPEIKELFGDEVYFVGSDRDREVGARTYPDWKTFDDHGSFKELADFLALSTGVLGVGSSVVALAGVLKVPCIRVHDPIQEMARQIWDNLGKSQLNRTELELRKEWPDWRDKWLKS